MKKPIVLEWFSIYVLKDFTRSFVVSDLTDAMFSLFNTELNYSKMLVSHGYTYKIHCGPFIVRHKLRLLFWIIIVAFQQFVSEMFVFFWNDIYIMCNVLFEAATIRVFVLQSQLSFFILRRKSKLSPSLYFEIPLPR